MKSVRRKLIFAFLSVIASAVIVCAVIFLANDLVVQRYRALTEDLLLENQLIERADVFVNDYFLYTKSVTDVGRRLVYQHDRQFFEDTLKTLEDHADGRDGWTKIMAVRNTVTSLMTEAEAAVKEAEQGDVSLMTAHYDEAMRLADFVKSTGTDLIISDLARLDTLNQEASRSRSLLNSMAALLMALLILGSVIYALSFIGRLDVAIRSLLTFSERVQRGDLTASVDPAVYVEDNEISALSSVATATVRILQEKIGDLERASARTRAIVERAPFGAHSFRLEPDGRLIFLTANSSAEKILGVRHASLFGKTIEEAFPGTVGTQIPDAYRRVAVTGIPFEQPHFAYSEGKIDGVFELSAVQTATREVTVFFRDVTAQARTEEGLRRSEQELREAQAVAHIGSWRTLAQTGELSLSDEARDILGLDREQILNTNAFAARFVVKEDRPKVEEMMAKGRLGVSREPITVKVARPDGTHRHVWIKIGQPLKDDAGAVVGYVGIIQDVTERHRLEKSLQESELLYRTLVESVTDVIFTADLEGHITYFSPRAAQFGLEQSRALGQELASFVEPEGRDRLMEGLRRLVAGEQALESAVVSLMGGDNREKLVEVSGRLLKDRHQRPYGVIGVMRDVTERNRMMKRLEESERRWRAYIENSRDIVYTTDLNGLVTYVSPQIARLGFQIEAVVGAPVQSIIHPDDRDQVMRRIAAFNASQSVSDAAVREFRLLAPDGTVTTVEESGLVQMEAGQPIGFVGVVRDVTARRRAEATVRESLEVERIFTRRSLSLLTVPPTDVNKEITGTLEEVGVFYAVQRASLFLLNAKGDAAERRLAWFRDGRPNPDSAALITVKDHPWFASRLVGGEITSFNGIQQMTDEIRRELVDIGVSENGCCIIAPLTVQGRRIGAFVLYDNACTRRWSESDLLSLRLLGQMFGDALERVANESRLHEADAIVSSGHGVAFTWRLEEGWPVEYVSRNVLRLTGYTDVDFSTGVVSYAQIIHPDDQERVRQEVADFSADRGRTEYRHEPYRIVAKDGLVKWVSDYTYIERDADGQPMRYRGFVEDITEQRAAEKKVAELNYLRQRFVHVIAHQLRTPLNSIRWSLEAMLSGELGDLKQTQRDFVRVVYDAEIEIISRIHDLLTALDIEEGRVTLSPEPTSVGSLLTSVLGEVETTATRRGLKMVKELAAAMPLTLNIDAEKARFAMKAIVENAVIYSHEGGRVAVQTSVDGQRLRLVVQDDGIGIPQAEQGSIFQRFFRASNASVINQNASGLSLSIAKYYLERQGGTLSFTSRENEGSTFVMELPLA